MGERQYDLSELGYKYHLNDYSAALGLANLDEFEKRLARRRQIAKQYTESLREISGIELFRYESDRESAYWLYGLHVERQTDFITALRSRGVTASVIHQRIDRNTLFGGKQSDLVNQTRFDKTQVHIPLHDGMSQEDVESVIGSIKLGW